MAVLASDAFNRANETPLSGGGTWVAVTGSLGTWDLVTNAARPHTFSTDCEAYYSGITWPDDQFSRATIAVTGTSGGGVGMGLSLRCSSSAHTLYRLAIDHAASNNVDVARIVAGAYTSIVRFTQAWNDGDTWEFQAQGSTLRVFLNSVQVSTDQTDANIGSGSPGIAYSSSASGGVGVDNLEGGSLAGVAAIPGGQVLARVQHFGRVSARPQSIAM